VLSPYVDYTPEDDRRSLSPMLVRVESPFRVIELAVKNEHGQFIGTVITREARYGDLWSLRGLLKDLLDERI
jgi:hypothetical protein